MNELGERLAAARGAVLDGLAGLQGLADLLRSHKVGVRGLARALPEVAEGLGDTIAAVGEVRAVVGAEGEEARALAALAPAEDALCALRTELAGAGASLDARRRIALEVRIAGLVRDLDVALLLAELFGACLEPRPTSLDLGDLLLQRWPIAEPPEKRGRRDSAGVRRAVLSVPPGSTFTGDARTASTLLDVAVGVVLEAGATAAHVRARRDDARLVVSVAEAAPSALASGATLLLVRARPLPKDALALASVAARRSGAELAVGPGPADATVTL